MSSPLVVASGLRGELTEACLCNRVSAGPSSQDEGSQGQERSWRRGEGEGTDEGAGQVSVLVAGVFMFLKVVSCHVGGDLTVLAWFLCWQGNQEEEGSLEGVQGKEGEACQESEGPECPEASPDRILHLLVSGEARNIMQGCASFYFVIFLAFLCFFVLFLGEGWA